MLDWLENFYKNLCNGDWEHQYGIKIDSLDNPGWKVKIDLMDTPFLQKEFKRIEIEKSELNWIHCWIEADVFTIACGPQNLTEAITIFKDFVEKK